MDVAAGGSKLTAAVVQEQLEVGKRAVQRGGVRIYNRQVDQRVEKQVELHDERGKVEKRPVDRAATQADMDVLRDQTIEVVETTKSR